MRVHDLANERRLARGRHCTAAILAVLALVLPLAAPVRAAPLTPVPELTLPAALMLMPDTPTTRSTGVWYADYALAERVYGVGDIAGMTDPRITRFFQALVGLRPGPETGVSALTRGRWRQVYGYDLFQITSEIYTDGAGAPRQPFGVDVGRLDTSYIAHVLATAGYTRSAVADDRFLVRAPALYSGLPNAAMNAVAVGAHRLVAGVWPADVITTSLRLQSRSGTLGQDRGSLDHVPPGGMWTRQARDQSSNGVLVHREQPSRLHTIRLARRAKRHSGRHSAGAGAT